jgi:transcriptional regulator with XRE-family HTH domain
MPKKFSELADRVTADPARAARVDEYERAIDEALALAALRELLEVTQARLADTLRVTQANVSRIEHQHDLYVSTLATYVAALGGRLEITAVFPEREIPIDVPAVDEVAAEFAAAR